LLLEYLFNIDTSTVCRTSQIIMALIKKGGKYIVDLGPRPNKKTTTLEELKNLIPDLDEILADCTEQKIPRPGKKAKRNKYHSGKKKAFTLKTQISTNRQGLLVSIDKPVPGRQHDYKVFKKSNLPKIIPILHQIYRNLLQNYETTFGFVANIVNFRMLCRLNTA